MIKLGFIGTGNMGGALAKAAAANEAQPVLMLANRTAAKAEALKADIIDSERLKCDLSFTSPEEGASDACQAAMERIIVTDNSHAAQEADYIFLGVKPQMMRGMLEGIKTELASRQTKPVLITMAAGLTMDSICEMAGAEFPVIRIMPNTPAAVGEGMILYCSNALVRVEELKTFLGLMKAAGRFGAISEAQMDAGSAVSGCGPAFVYLFAEAMADGGVACGLSRQQAAEYAAQTLLGAAELLLKTGENPGRLKDAVCSPGGTTIQGVRKLEEGGFRGTVMDAVIAAYEKTLELKQ